MLSLLAASGVAEPIYWENLGLRPYLFEIGGFQLRFYSLAYLLGILFAYWHLSKMIKAPGAPMAQRHADDLFFYCTLGVILGGRIGYAAFYKPELFASADVFKLWEGGMSFHGGVIGVLVAISWVAWRGGLNWLRVCDYIAVNVPVGYMLGRLANFVNAELYGRPVESDFPLAMVFPTDPDLLPRHPSQLYQAGFEGLMLGLLLLLLFWQTRARWRPGLLVAVFTIGMGLGRFLMEFFREPDAHLAYVVAETGLSRGQWLSLPMIAIGLAVLAYALLRPAIGSTRAGAAPAA
ncbi:prolipoprotein diacylglyceryl transferase [Qipengyuania flava]|uniref:prolipoprotein diacylglyceryl transferase n=1 Tax=Qipengyuania flava TaxID=192812 RepID=UPI000B8C4BCD|nr:prolipoprotein diacylglyceryl transferase [Qipengyuania flava]ASP28827.1 prolipoprotein diacylglyceryl transferase [Qipengyuania flava]ASP31501.1 prolipoprotein diacylglyceryl transferase [Qipengyuania flava]MCA0889154.1 prolipoprotein diacylglyceryl transferase [Qipengyuania flava]NIJ62039.1 phosphatidylglycerol:prolipoprotein diacylglycerol transferase [Qipengyuania flava]